MKHIFLALVLCGLMASGVMGQARLKRKGDGHYERLSYTLAIPYYERYLKKVPDDHQALMRLAESYRLAHDYTNAAETYARVVLLPECPPISHYHFGHCLLQTQQLEEAKEAFAQYARLAPEDPRGANYLAALDRYDRLLADSIRVTLDHCEELGINTPETEFGVFPYQDGLIYAAAREVGPAVVQDFNWMDDPFLNFFYLAPRKDSASWGKPERLEGEANTRYHESNFTMADGGDAFYFTRNNYFGKQKGQNEQGIILLKIYKATIVGLETAAVEEFPYNSDQYSVTHPAISPDGESLYFVSDMPGGVGGKDLYRCRKSGNGWTQPENLTAINTPGDEMFPFIHADGTLYFSSDGHPGLGHLDLFSVKAGSNQPLNMGYPLNSAYDDFAIYLDRSGKEGYFASDRVGGLGKDDIYHFLLQKPTLEIFVLDSIAALPIEGATVTLYDLSDQTTQALQTDSLGRVAIETDFGHQFKAVIEAGEFDPVRIQLTTDINAGTLLYSHTEQLFSAPPAFTGIVIDDSTGARLPGAAVEFVNVREKKSEIVYADRNGRFRLIMKPNTLYEINARHKGYLTYTDQISTSMKEFRGDTVIPLKMERIPFNKPILLENIHYDFDKWTIRYDAYDDLIMVANLMQKNPTLIVELGSHTDCRGSDVYNEKLAQKRANSARYFIIDLGIAPERIVGKGYGESQLSNSCDDGVPCSEAQHFANRRTEFKIIGEVEGVDMEQSTLETKEGGTAPVYVPER